VRMADIKLSRAS